MSVVRRVQTLQLMEQQRQSVLAELQEREKQAKQLDEEKAKLAKTTASLKDDIDVSERGRCVLTPMYLHCVPSLSFLSSPPLPLSPSLPSLPPVP